MRVCSPNIPVPTGRPLGLPDGFLGMESTPLVEGDRPDVAGAQCLVAPDTVDATRRDADEASAGPQDYLFRLP